MENMTDDQRKLALAEFEAKQGKRHFIGKLIVMIIALLNILFSVMSAIANFNIFSLIIQITLSIALFLGVTWVRYLFAIGSGLSVMLGFYLLMVVISDPPVLITVFLVTNMAFNIISSILLFTNKCVSEFLYAQKNG